MYLDENDGKLSGTFRWDYHDLNLSVDGTVNSKRQVNMETEDDVHRCVFALRSLKDDTFLDGSIQYYVYSEEAQASFHVDGGAFEANIR